MAFDACAISRAVSPLLRENPDDGFVLARERGLDQNGVCAPSIATAIRQTPMNAGLPSTTIRARTFGRRTRSVASWPSFVWP